MILNRKKSLVVTRNILLTLVLSTSSVMAGENTQNTQRNGMNSCPVGEFVVGAHLRRNTFLCTTNLRAYNRNQERVNNNTQRRGMHSCPLNWAITGIHKGKNLLACAPVRKRVTEFVDRSGTHQRFGMHACPKGMVLTGLHQGRNDFLCGFQAVNPG